MSKLTPEDFKNQLIDIVCETIKQDKEVLKFKEILSKMDSSNNVVPPTHPEPRSLEIKSTTETAYQRAIYVCKETQLFDKDNVYKTVKWIDYELPIVFNGNPKRYSIDLIGTLDDDRPTLCELKFANPATASRSNSPVYAAIQLLTYYCIIQFNALRLNDGEVFRFKQNPVKWNTFVTGFPCLIVCANQSYWDRWLRSSKFDTGKLIKWGKDHGLDLCFYRTINPDFPMLQAQKGGGLYAPKIIDNSAWEIG